MYYKHQELVAAYHVSLKTVHNWIDATRQGKLGLELVEKNGRTYISNSPGNNALLEGLSVKGKKYRNSRFQKVASPKKEFYELFSRTQILDIITSLDVHHEIPRQYNYFEEGAESWDKYTQRLWREDGLNYVTATVSLLEENRAAVDRLIKNHKRVNVIDIGPGNGLPVKGLLTYLQERGKLHRYVAIDISKEMLHIVESNIKEWFDGSVRYEGYVRDITHGRFDDLLVDDMLDKDAEQTVNLVLLLGGTLMNFREPSDTLKVVASSMGLNDIMIYSVKPDTEVARRHFDFNPKPGSSTLSPNHRFIFDLLNIDESLYDVENGFNERKCARYIRVRLKVGLTIKFKFRDGERSVKLEKGDTILLLRVWHSTALEIISSFEKVGLTMLQSSLTEDRQFLLAIFGVDAKPELEA